MLKKPQSYSLSYADDKVFFFYLRSSRLKLYKKIIVSKESCSFPLDSSLLGHVISNLTVPDVMSCSFECLKIEQCLSYNFKDERNSSRNICELNNATMATSPNAFYGRPGYIYYDTQKV